MCDGLLISGGEDIYPARYGEETLPACGAVNKARDRFELALLAEAERREMPVFGICRGAQILNVFCGGTLIQDIPSQLSLPNELHSPGSYNTTHPISILPGTRLAAILGAGAHFVNSSHHQSVKVSPLTIAARDENGVTEAIESVGERFVVGVQWHPERMEDERLFAAFAAACQKGRE